MKKVAVGVIGCGNISTVYLENMTKVFDILEVKAVVDIDRARAQQAADHYGIPVVYDSVEQMLADRNIEIILNITTPPYHGGICLAALEAGKNVYVEKPLAITRDEGLMIKQLAEKKGLLAGGAPDTFLGGGIQTCRKLIDDGWIGEPVAYTAFMMCHGHEGWHPDPEFYYKAGGGPMFDMGPYYLTALINLMGPVESVASATRITFPTRTITSEKKYGNIIDVKVPTHVAGLINFKGGAIGTIITSFDVWAAQLPRIEIYGSIGTLSVPDPNTFGGPVRYYSSDLKEWREVPLRYEYTGNSRGIGVADMAFALRNGRNPRADIDLTFHVLDIMHAFHNASNEGVVYKLDSTCVKPTPMMVGLLRE